MVPGAPPQPRACMHRLLLLFTLLLSGCYIDFDGKPIRGEDDEVLIPAFRVQADLGPNRGDEPGLRMGIAAELERIQGDFDFDVAAGENLDVAGNAALGRVVTDFDATQLAVMFRLAHRTPYGFELAFHGGPTFLDLELELRNGILTERQTKERHGLRLGMDLHYEIRDWYGPYLRGHFDSMTHSAYTRNVELGMLFKPLPELHGFVGLRYWNFEEERMWNATNDVDIEARGIVLGMQLRF